MPDETPPWPSLYDPGLEILHIPHRPPTQPGGVYLYHANDIFRFTLYWTLIFYTPFFLVCGAYAFFNLSFPPSLSTSDKDNFPLSTNGVQYIPVRRALHARSSRLTFTIIVFLAFLALGVAGAVIGSAVLAFVLYGLYRSGGYNMSTWIPFLWAAIQCLVGLLSIWPSVIDII